MSQARPVHKNTTLMLTRRVRRRRFLLRPSQKTNQLLRYVVAVMAQKWNIRLHAIVVMSNHWHLCVTDPGGNIVEFQRDCHAFVARGLNAAHGEFESVWSSSQGSRVECADRDSVVSQIAYVMTNPVEARLVRHGKSWPGVRHAWPCRSRSVKRPEKFFRSEQAGGEWPKSVLLELERPPGFDDLPDDELHCAIEQAIGRREDKFRAAHDASKRSFLGRKSVLRQSRHARPNSREPRFQMSPRVACRDKWRRIERLALDKAWALAYSIARKAWCGGERGVIFPNGTYKMRMVHGCACLPAPG